VPGVADVDVDGEEHPVAVVGGDRERLGQALGESPFNDLGHLYRMPCSAIQSGLSGSGQ
jgi:hypothetical protein